MKNNTRIRQR